MTTPREQAVAELRQSIDVLPERTRKAMLIGLGNNTVITGAFSGGGGTACPMLAAHRAGGRTRACSFPEAWDRFTGVAGRQIIRPATDYEVLILRREIEASLEPAGPTMFAEAIAEHKSAARTRRSREAESTGLNWLFEETLVLPEDFEQEPVAEAPGEPRFDFDAAENDLLQR